MRSFLPDKQPSDRVLRFIKSYGCSPYSYSYSYSVRQDGTRTQFRFWIVPLRPGRRTARGSSFDRQRKPKAEEVKRLAKCRFVCRAIATLPRTRSHRVRAPYAFSSFIPYQIPRAPSSLTLLSQDSRNASVDMRIGPIAVIRTRPTPINCMVKFFIAR